MTDTVTMRNGIDVDQLVGTIDAVEQQPFRDLDVARFLGLDGPRAGFTEIRVKGRVSNPNASLEVV